MNPDLKEMIKTYLTERSYDGLYCDNGEIPGCGCELEDLIPCGEIRMGCKAGYKRPCDCDEDCGFHMCSE